MAESVSSDRNADASNHVKCSKVHFPAEQLSHHDSQIVVNADEDCKCLDVHLGFLQLLNDYHLNFTIPDKLGKRIICDPLQNVNVQLLEAVPTDDGKGHNLLLNFKAQKEKIMKEELVLISDTDNNAHLKLILHARVIGKGKGTPALRSGVHCVKSHADDEDSHLSDWQGFD